MLDFAAYPFLRSPMLSSRFRSFLSRSACIAVSTAALTLLPGGLHAQGAATLGSLVQGLGVSARVLVIAAHPDDEDTQLITWLTRGRHVQTAYLSLTRGDGGQNLIGNELGEALGAIRTQELLAARRLDGGQQYFTRAFDFGFSKNAEETLTQWSRDSILRDVVTVVRQFRPHVIVAVFSGTPSDGHGHHQVSGIFAREAYEAAGDSVRFPLSATAGFGPWTVSKFYRGAFFRMQDRATIRMNVGEFNPLLGRSYSEIASDSRSQHKSQAMGSLQQKGTRFDQLLREASRAPGAPADPKSEKSILDGIDTTWARFSSLMRTPAQRAALDSLPGAFTSAQKELDLTAPGKVVPSLLRVSRLLSALCSPRDRQSCAGTSARDSEGRPVEGPPAGLIANELSVRNSSTGDLGSSVAIALSRVDAALVAALGLAVEATAPREVWALQEAIPVTVHTYNRGARAVRITGMATLGEQGLRGIPSARAESLSPDSSRVDSIQVTLQTPSQTWWLELPRQGAMFTPRVTGIAETARRPAASVIVRAEVDGVGVHIESPVVYRYADPIKGEIQHPIAGAPAITLSLDEAVAYAQANVPIQRELRVYVRSHASDARDVTVSLHLPPGLVADSMERRVRLDGNAGNRVASGPGAAFGIGGGAAPERVHLVTFNVRGRLTPGRHDVRVLARSGGATYATGYSTVNYDHIQPQRLYRPASLGIEAVDAKFPRGFSIAYINGVGDNVAPMLEQLGVAVTIVDPASLPRTDLSKFGAVVVGTRAYEASEALVANNARLLQYARDGGTLVVQYGQYEMTQPGVMPFPITLSRPADRVTVEDAPVTILDPAARALNVPNAIRAADFAGWVQDRSLYMPRTFDAAYTPLLEMHDPGEDANRGAVLIAPLGKGTYVYTTLAFFRQLPNGVPGAARLFLNLLTASTMAIQP